MSSSLVYKVSSGLASDMGFPSVCCEHYWLIKKLLCSPDGNSTQMEEKAGRFRETDAEPGGVTQMNRNGLI